uniref:Uncharacterized protein n=1 Tax=Fundulus heteroclitus TaxID=8078 RepID=A0A3Q2P522_FUNHE
MASPYALVFCLLGLFVLCHADCFFQELVIKDSTNPPKGECVDEDGKEHGFRSEWVSVHGGLLHKAGLELLPCVRYLSFILFLTIFP